MKSTRQKNKEEADKAEKQARGTISRVVRRVALPGLGGARLYPETLYDLVHAVTADVLVGVQKRHQLNAVLPKAARAAARVIKKTYGLTR